MYIHPLYRLQRGVPQFVTRGLRVKSRHTEAKPNKCLEKCIYKYSHLFYNKIPPRKRDFVMLETTSFGNIHTLQISDKEMYALEPLLLDTITSHKYRIADIRKELTFLLDTPCKDVQAMLAEVQALEGKIAILKDLAEQLDLL